jgi:potassium-transporting ATPase KdpC subunit
MKTILRALRLFIILTILTGMVYPATITVLAQVFLPYQANGSLVRKNGTCIGSDLLAQNFHSGRYFWPRPSVSNFATVPSGASNQGPTSAALEQTIQKRAEFFRKNNGLSLEVTLPPDVLFASASGLDPHISPQAARLQVERIVRIRKFNEGQRQRLYRLVDQYIELLQFGILGEPRVNVFRLNLALDSL